MKKVKFFFIKIRRKDVFSENQDDFFINNIS